MNNEVKDNELNKVSGGAEGGAIYNNPGTSVEFNNPGFIGNQGGAGGGAVYNNGAVAFSGPSANFVPNPLDNGTNAGDGAVWIGG